MSRWKSILRLFIMPVFVGAIIFTAAGRWDLPLVWGVLGVLTALLVAVAIFADPGMLRERQAPGPGNKDRLTRPLGAALLLAHWVLAGLDVGRFHWSPVPLWMQIVGLLGYAAAMVVLFWAMRANPFYSSAVRVQMDRGHTTVMSGPYRYVRHPGYAASLVGVLSGGVALGSWLAMLPILAFGLLWIRRTLLEDQLLQHELPGYADYAQQVRYRLLAGVF